MLILVLTGTFILAMVAPRGDAARITRLKERSARDLLARLVGDGILGSETPKGAVSLRFPLHAVEILFPSLFPET